jgi:hypothetical protein
MTTKSETGAIYCDNGWLPFYYAFVPSEKVWKKEMRRLNIAEPDHYPSHDGCCSTFTTAEGGLVCLVTINEKMDERDPAGIVGLIIHEGLHVWQAVLEDIGEKKPSSEFESYSCQRINQQLIEAYVMTRKPDLFAPKNIPRASLFKRAITSVSTYFRR